MRIIAMILFLMPLIQGIEFLICSKNRWLAKVAKYKEKENYEYINKLYAKSYMGLGAIIAVFCNIINFLYDIFCKSPKHILIALLIVLVAEVFMDAFVDIRLKVDKLDEELEKKEKK